MKKKDPNELRGDNVDMTIETDCVRCGMPRESWAGNKGKGIHEGDETFCCKGCADDTGCSCADEAEQDD